MRFHPILTLTFLLIVFGALAETPDGVFLEKLGKRNASYVHDPSTIVPCKDEFWFFCTGIGVNAWRSKDLFGWKKEGTVFPTMPNWVTNIVTGHRGHFWAPDVIFHDGRYLLYYSISSFGVNRSAIALASNPTLDPGSANYKWTDQGVVLESFRTNNFNAIDPQIVKTPEGELWMVFGSFWSGIKLIQLDGKTGLRAAPDSPIYSLAHHAQIEAPAIVHHDGFYYLFVNWGFCCRGTNSTYEIRVGRGKNITGPYFDKEGVDMLRDGGSIFLKSEGEFIGPGHAGVFEAQGKTWFSCHFYDGARRGAATLAIRPFTWSGDGWPRLDPAGPSGR